MIIRKMRPEELDLSVNVARMYSQEAKDEITEQFDTNSVIGTIRSRTIEDSSFWLNAMEGGSVVGFVSGCLTSAQWNDNILYAHIDLIYLKESKRNMNNFRQMLDSVEEWGAQFNVEKITAGDIGVDPERSEKLYEALGFDKAVWMTKDVS